MNIYRYIFYTNIHNLLNEPEGLDDVTMWTGYQPHHVVSESWYGQVEADDLFDAAEQVFTMLNAPDRPTGVICPSMSVGDVVVLHTPDGPVGMACEHLGFRQVPAPENIDARSWAEVAHA